MNPATSPRKRKYAAPTTIGSFHGRGRAELPKCRNKGFLPLNSYMSSVTLSPSTLQAVSGSLPSHPNHRQQVGCNRYPPYLIIPYIQISFRLELVKGTICKLIMQLLSEHLPLQEIVVKLRPLWTSVREGFDESAYDLHEVQAIVRTCREMGLGEHNELEANYENEGIEGGWMQSACAEDLRLEPVDGDKGNEGWWTQQEDRNNRDWRDGVVPTSARRNGDSAVR